MSYLNNEWGRNGGGEMSVIFELQKTILSEEGL